MKLVSVPLMRRRWTGLARVGLVTAMLAGAVASLAGITPADAAATTFTGLVPARLLETRVGAGLVTVDGQYQGIGVVGAGVTLELPVLNRGGVPASGVGAVALNVTVTEPTAASFVTVFPTGRGRPTASNLNMVAGQTVSNMVIVPVGTGGRVSLFNLAGSTEMIVDVLGWFPTGASFGGLTPARLLETRVGAGLVTVDGQYQGIGALAANREIVLPVLNRGGVPASGVGAVALNVTVTQPTAGSFVTVYPTGQVRPTASNLNMVAGQTVSNMVIVPVGVNGRISLYNLAGSTEMIVDVLGWFPAATVAPTTTTTAPPPTPFTRLVNSALGGTASGGAAGVAISANGRYVAFDSTASDLVPGDTNGDADVFVRDLVSNSIVRASLTSIGGQASGTSQQPTISSNGQFVAFFTNASLVPADNNGLDDIYVRDLAGGQTIWVSVGQGGAASNGLSNWPSISGNGRYVVFNSTASNLVSGDTNGHIDVFIRDLQTNTTERASVATGGAQADGGFGSFDADVSDDGNLVVFSSNEPNLGGPDSGVRHIYVRDRDANTTTLLTRATNSLPSVAGVSQDPSISADGNWVMFHSDSADLVAGDTNAIEDVFRVAAVGGSMTRVGLSTGEGMSEGANGMISGDGRYVTFSSDVSGSRQVYRYDANTASTMRFSVDTDEVDGNGISNDSVISGDGRSIAFLSTSTNLGGTVSGGTNVYVRFVP
jgi:Tol biopolymer transport system component